MKEYAPNIRSSELTLVDVPTSSGNAASTAATATAAPGTVPPATSEDRYLIRAAKEHAAGHVDPSLWAHALARAGDDKALATRIYLESRATALRVAKRNEDEARRARVVEVLSNAPEPGFVAEQSPARDETAAKEASRTRGPSRRMILVAAVFGLVVLIAGSVALLWPESGPAQPGKPAGAASAVGASARSNSSTAWATANASGILHAGASAEEIARKVQELEKEANWNLVVIYATEWTRKQPGNTVAWIGLSQSYLKLRQFGDALDAATKAIQVAPDNYLPWQNLGHLYVALQRPVEALSAFEHARALNDLDIVSLVQEGMLSTQLGRLAEARIAFDKALSLSPENELALCGAASLARKEGWMKDAEAMTTKVASLDAACPDPSTVESMRVAAGDPAQNRAKPPAVRRPQ
jgi:cytochrome c-type biogenesis protein CcmH/NrfG